MFATDTDLFVFDPTPFAELTHLGRHVLRATVQVEGDVATLTQPDIPLSAVVASAGDVLVVAGLALELTAAIAGNQVAVSLPRVRGEGSVPPPPFATQVGVITSFAAPRAIVSRRMLAHAGIDPDDAEAVARITNAAALVDTHVVGTLALLYRTAGVLLAEDAPVNIRARELHRVFDQLRERVPIRMDTCARRSVPSQPMRG